MAAANVSIAGFLDKVNGYILNPLIGLVFAVAFLIFFWGIFQFIRAAGSDKERGEAKKKITYGLLGMFIMFSAYGLIRIILTTFGINQTNSQSYIQF